MVLDLNWLPWVAYMYMAAPLRWSDIKIPILDIRYEHYMQIQEYQTPFTSPYKEFEEPLKLYRLWFVRLWETFCINRTIRKFSWPVAFHTEWGRQLIHMRGCLLQLLTTRCTTTYNTFDCYAVNGNLHISWELPSLQWHCTSLGPTNAPWWINN